MLLLCVVIVVTVCCYCVLLLCVVRVGPEWEYKNGGNEERDKWP